jgi:hypothetical protein
MATVRTDGGVIHIEIEGMDKVLALKGSLDIPLEHVRSVEVAPPDLKPKGVRAPGTSIPGRIYAGTWRGRGTKEFWDIRHKEKALVLNLDGDEYTRVVIEVDAPDDVADRIERARREFLAMSS